MIDKVKKQLEELREVYETALEGLIKEIFDSFVKPILDKHDLGFRSGYGTWIVVDMEKNVVLSDSELDDIDEENLPEEMVKDLRKINDVFKMEIPLFDTENFGLMAHDYDPSGGTNET